MKYFRDDFIVSDFFLVGQKMIPMNAFNGWLLFNANSVIFQLYHGEIKLIFNEVHFVLD